MKNEYLLEETNFNLNRLGLSPAAIIACVCLL